LGIIDLKPLSTGGDELLRDHAADDLLLEEVVGLGVGSMKPPTLAVLAGAAGLLLVRVVVLGLAADRLAVGDLRRARLDLARVLALHALDVDLEVELAHAGR
jgi:hypothetical protein